MSLTHDDTRQQGGNRYDDHSESGDDDDGIAFEDVT